MPTGYIFPGVSTRCGVAAQDSVHQPPRLQLALQLGVVVLPLPHLTADPHDGDQHDEVQEADQVQEGPGNGGADDAGPVVQRRVVVPHRSVQRPYPEVQQDGEDEDDGRVTQREEVADAEGALRRPESASGSCCRWPQCGRRRRRGASPACRRGPRSRTRRTPSGSEMGVMVERQGEHAPTEDVQAENGRGHQPHLGPLLACQAVANLADSTGRSRHVRGPPEYAGSRHVAIATLRQMRVTCNKLRAVH